jgi:DNA polymerase-3 subunit alpha
MLDGAARIEEMVDAAVADGQSAIGITDHGNLYGVIEFFETCRDRGVRPIIGLEAYMAAESRFDRPARRGKLDDTGGDTDGGQKLYHHITLLAENDEGYSNLVRASSMAYLEGYYYKPRLDWDLLERYSGGLIATSGCLGGVVLQALVRDDYRRALELAGRLQSIFGREGFFIELQDHGIPEQARTNPGLINIARDLGAPLLATNDLHYVRHGDAEMHDALLCVGTGSLIADPNRFKFQSQEHYLKSSAEMRHIFRDLPEACDNTLLIAERAKVEITFDNDALPEFPVPIEHARASHAESANAYLRELTLAGAAERYGDALGADVRDRLDYELRVITDMGFADYFLVVWDLIRHARENGIRVGPGRGSAAGCCVAYCLRIVDIDPMRNALIFERFLNPGRKQMPDIDMDFDERYRGEMIRYAAERYGADHVAQIVTFSTIKARAAVRDAARVLGFPPLVGDKIAKAMPPLVMGKDVPLAACLDRVPGFEDRYGEAAELREMYGSDPEVKKTVDVALGFVDKRRQDGIHAAAVVITKDPVMDYVPVQRKPGPNGSIEDAPIVTQFEMHAIERLGLLKMDFLGLRNLAIIDRTIELIRQRQGTAIDIDSVSLEDPEVYSMLSRGSSIGILQLEGGPMRALMRRLQPTSFDDVAALVALYRPGPMGENTHNHYAERKNGRQEVTYDHEDLRGVLDETYGLMIYQEDIMRVAQRIAGYSMTEADNLRKACAKKIREMIVDERSKFVAGAVAKGYSSEFAEALFDKIEPFADYAFNKPHAYGYALVAYQNAWLKCHYPVEYLSALLTSFKDDKDKTAVYLAECRSNGITVRVPDVNESFADFTPSAADGSTINFGLAAVRNVGESLVDKIVSERESAGRYTTVYDFVRRVDPSVLNKRSMESLIKAGAFDSLGVPRQGFALVVDELVDRTLERRRELAVGVVSLFSAIGEDGRTDDWGGTEIEIPDLEFDRATRLSFEREMLGLYVSEHPLLGLEGQLRKLTDGTISEARERAEEVGERGESYTIGGVISEVQLRTSRRGDTFARLVIEDLGGSIEAMVFAKAFANAAGLLERDNVVTITGRLEKRDDVVRFSAQSVRRPAFAEIGEDVLCVHLDESRMNADGIHRLKEILAANAGPTSVVVEVSDARMFKLGPEFNVNTQTAIAELRAAFGQSVVA